MLFYVNNMNDHKIPASMLKGLVTLTLVVGLAGGGAAGALVATYIQNDGLPTGADEDLSFNRAQTMVVEDSSIVETIDSASASVVSIIIEKPASQATGNVINPFGSPFFNFQIPGFEIVPEQQQPEPETDVETEEEEYVQVGGGSGFVVSEDGLILTNKHVVKDEDARFSVLTKDGESYDIEILGTDPVNDLALVKIKGDVKLPPLELADSDGIQIGQTVIAIGNSLGEFNNTVTKGVVSGIDRRVTAGDGAGFSEVLEAAIQTDAAINPGNSGGPLLNAAGQVVGVNTAVSQEGQLIGFAIPINDAVRLIEGIQEHGRVIRPYLGVRYILINKRIQKANDLTVDYGALLRRGEDPSELAVIPGGPADKAGLEENDIILEVEGEKIDENNSLVRALADYAPGDTINIKVLKDGEEVQLKLTLGEFKTDDE